MDIMDFKQPAGQSAVKCVQTLCAKALRCRLVSDIQSLDGTFFIGSRQSKLQFVGRYRAKTEWESLQKLAHQAMSLANLQSSNETPESEQSRSEHTNEPHRNARNIKNVESVSVLRVWSTASAMEHLRCNSFWRFQNSWRHCLTIHGQTGNWVQPWTWSTAAESV